MDSNTQNLNSTDDLTIKIRKKFLNSFDYHRHNYYKDQTNTEMSLNTKYDVSLLFVDKNGDKYLIDKTCEGETTTFTSTKLKISPIYHFEQRVESVHYPDRGFSLRLVENAPGKWFIRVRTNYECTNSCNLDFLESLRDCTFEINTTGLEGDYLDRSLKVTGQFNITDVTCNADQLSQISEHYKNVECLVITDKDNFSICRDYTSNDMLQMFPKLEILKYKREGEIEDYRSTYTDFFEELVYRGVQVTTDNAFTFMLEYGMMKLYVDYEKLVAITLHTDHISKWNAKGPHTEDLLARCQKLFSYYYLCGGLNYCSAKLLSDIMDSKLDNLILEDVRVYHSDSSDEYFILKNNDNINQAKMERVKSSRK